MQTNAAAVKLLERERRDAMKERRVAREKNLYEHWGRYDLLAKTLARLIRELRAGKAVKRG